MYKKKKEEEKNQNGKSEFPVMVDEKSIVQFSFVQLIVDACLARPVSFLRLFMNVRDWWRSFIS